MTYFVFQDLNSEIGYDLSMRGFKWNSGQAVFLSEVDAEHRAIVQAGGELHQAIQGGASSERVRDLLRALSATLEEHFAHEERLMEATRYSSLQWHTGQHNAARRRVQECAGRVEAGEAKAASELLDYLGHWIRDHIAVADRMMGAHVRNHRLGNAAPRARVG